MSRTVPLDYSIAFQPIVDASKGTIWAQEGLPVGCAGDTFETLLFEAGPEGQFQLDADIRRSALSIAGTSSFDGKVILNVLPAAMEGDPQFIEQLLKHAKASGVAPDRILLKISENEIIVDIDAFSATVEELRFHGMNFAIGDFGSGFAGLNLLADFQPDLVKLDRVLVNGIRSRGPRQAIVRGVARTCFDLGIDVIAEGVETIEEYSWFRDEGITLFQGSLFAKPIFGAFNTRFSLPDKGRGAVPE